MKRSIKITIKDVRHCNHPIYLKVTDIEIQTKRMKMVWQRFDHKSLRIIGCFWQYKTRWKIINNSTEPHLLSAMKLQYLSQIDNQQLQPKHSWENDDAFAVVLIALIIPPLAIIADIFYSICAMY